jgi:hypothetical protein
MQNPHNSFWASDTPSGNFSAQLYLNWPKVGKDNLSYIYIVTFTSSKCLSHDLSLLPIKRDT